jgi:hypothetical protein
VQGRNHDAWIWRNGPARPLPAGLQLLADSGYEGCGNGELVTPFKRPKRQLLEYDEWMYNSSLGWFRSTIEHTFAYIKRFGILKFAFRGSLDTAGLLRLHNAFKVILHIRYGAFDWVAAADLHTPIADGECADRPTNRQPIDRSSRRICLQPISALPSPMESVQIG